MKGYRSSSVVSRATDLGLLHGLQFGDRAVSHLGTKLRSGDVRETEKQMFVIVMGLEEKVSW